MAQRLKSWESPRKEGRNNKGKGGSARARQLKKQQQMLRKKLKGEGDGINKQENHQKDKRGKINFPSLFLCERSKRNLVSYYQFDVMNQPYIFVSETRFLRK